MDRTTGHMAGENRLGPLVKKARLALGLTQPQLAKQCGISNYAISRIERSGSDSGIPKADVLLKLAQQLHLPFDELVRVAGYPVCDGDEAEVGWQAGVSVYTLAEAVDRADELPPRAKRAIHDILELARGDAG